MEPTGGESGKKCTHIFITVIELLLSNPMANFVRQIFERGQFLTEHWRNCLKGRISIHLDETGEDTLRLRLVNKLPEFTAQIVDAGMERSFAAFPRGLLVAKVLHLGDPNGKLPHLEFERLISLTEGGQI